MYNTGNKYMKIEIMEGIGRLKQETISTLKKNMASHS